MRTLYDALGTALSWLGQRGQAPRRLRPARTGRRIRFESLESRLALAGDALNPVGPLEVEFDIQLVKPDGSVLGSLSAGEDFVLRVLTTDVRSEPLGVFAAYLDISWDISLAIATGPLAHSPTYSNGTSGVVFAGLLDESGGFAGSFRQGGGAFEVFSVPMRALSAGTLHFIANPADTTPSNDVLVHGENGARSDERIVYGTASIEVSGTYIAGHDAFNVLEDSKNTTLAPLTNDTGIGNSTGALTIASVGSTDRGGTIAIAADRKTLVYTPAANFNGMETFTYTAQNPNGERRTATVTMTVQEVNDPPTAANDVFEVPANSGSQVLNLLANDSTAPDAGETLRFFNSGYTGGRFYADGSTFFYAPVPNFVGSETITYTVLDRNSGALSAQATVTIHVIGLAAVSDTITVPDHTVPTMLDVLANDLPGNMPKEELRIVSVTSPSADVEIAVAADGKSLIYTGSGVPRGIVNLSYVVTNGQGDFGTAALALNFASISTSAPGIALEDNILHITGTPDRDKLTVSIGRHKLRVTGTLGSSRIDQTFNTRNVEQIIAALDDGNDALTIRGNARIAIQVDGGAGNDAISAAAGTAILLGGDGNDSLTGGSRRDLLIGGDGRDQLRGNGGDDLLIGDATAYDQDSLALAALQSEWNSSQVRSARIANLREGTGASVQSLGVALKQNETVFDDGEVDALFGNGSLDWLFDRAASDDTPLRSRVKSAARWQPLASG